MLASMLVAAVVAGPLPVTAHGPLPPAAAPREHSTDLAAALNADGTFRGAPGVAGTIDTSAWTLVSNLAAGERPRFAPAGLDVATPIGPWSALGSNGSGNGALNSQVYALAVSGTDLYVGGAFSNAAGITAADSVARWNGSAWSALGSNGSGDGALNNTVSALAVSGTDLYVGGYFQNAGGIAEADYIARWNGSAWSALGSNGSGDGALDVFVFALAVSGSGLYVSGDFTDAAGIATGDYIAKWNGSAWSALGSNGAGNGALNAFPVALAASGTDLYVGGFFQNAGGIAEADYIARWNGSAWSALGSNGSGDGALECCVHALAVSGTNLYVGGTFSNAAGIPTADFIARWNGNAWSGLGSNGSGDGALNAYVLALAVSGSELYVGGRFSDVAGTAEADFIARWNGSVWSALGSNGFGDGALNNDVNALAVTGSNLYAGGGFLNAAGIPEADHTAKWALAVVVASDTFSRSVTASWGSADIGGAYSTYSNKADYNVAGGAGTMRLPQAQATRRTILNGVSERDLDVTFRLKVGQLPTAGGSGQYVYLILRHQASGAEYRAKVRFAPAGGVYLGASFSNNGELPGETALAPEVRVPGLSTVANAFFRLHVQFVGTDPTTLRVKTWRDGTSEPLAWQYTATSSRAGLQQPGALGLMAYVSLPAANAPVTFGFDDLLATQVATGLGVAP
jgi:hypothetical protein